MTLKKKKKPPHLGLFVFPLANVKIKFPVKISCVTHGLVSCHFHEHFSLFLCLPNADTLTASVVTV